MDLANVTAFIVPGIFVGLCLFSLSLAISYGSTEKELIRSVPALIFLIILIIVFTVVGPENVPIVSAFVKSWEKNINSAPH